MTNSSSYVVPLKYAQVQPKLYRGSYPKEHNLPFLKALKLKTIVSLIPGPLSEENDPIIYKFVKDNNINCVHIPCKGAKDKKKDKKDKKVKERIKQTNDTEFSNILGNSKDGAIESNGNINKTEAEKSKKEEDNKKALKKVKRRDKSVPLTNEDIYDILQVLLIKKNYPIYIHCSNGELITSIAIACLRKMSYWSSVSIFNEFLQFSGNINVHERKFIEEFNANGFVPKDKNQEHYVEWITRREGWAGPRRLKFYSV
ncbi:uncharacterized protein SCODWIG_02464 [Saccharomycodes ludwigii]|uniref:Tyrosine-protein phosphatase OCA6 n=1 Tax=Saccharomycodes ludwigii TaxID=36035 RepID=A0A376B7P3_9ASCO|nr:hypothetical protein SCDLUD_001616 [Saccharomycodes ludwigii]KAH3901833.1 hypothetical protein SCDLUD_001616 [Saccharomycodes ludwigii]SSD60703.1 uncharacterized protein SCODWIG_02464 [Saccharomycodes ludwigii]